ncbi:MAG: tetratricopeptide repeat protein [Chloroflexi bacterium]|nr:tetratricopeptide repeat protein [Chloroflexota bacterium]
MDAYKKDSQSLVTGNFKPQTNDVLSASVPTNLPALRGKLIGRNADLKAILDLCNREDVRLVTLAGFGGAGKTTLALHAAHKLLERFSGGVFFIDLTSIQEPALILPTLAQTLGLQEDPNRDVADTLRDFLSNRAILFVLDNFEQLVSGANILANFLDANPHVHLLVTSRESLHLRGEHTLPLASLESADAMQVFVQYAQTLNPHFRLTEDNTPAITELCKKLDGLPLAIELAAMRTRMFTPQALLARLSSDLETDSPLLATLTSGPRDMPERQRTIRNIVAWSYNLLAEEEKQMLQAAALFRSGFGIRPLASVAAVPENEAEDILASLVAKNLVQPFYGGEMRFHLLESIREFALEQAREAENWLEIQSNFVFTFQKLTQAAVLDIETAQGVQGIPWLKAESSNMLAAVETALKAEDKKVLTAGMLVLEGFEHYWFPYCYYSEAKKYLSFAWQRVEDYGSDFDKAIVYGLLGTLHWCFLNIQAAADFHKLSADLLSTLDDDKRLGRALNNLAANLDFLGKFEESEKYYKQSLHLARQTGDIWSELRVLCNIGNNDPYYKLDERLTYLNNAHDLATHLGRNYEITTIEFNLACVFYQQGDLTRSMSYLEQCLRMSDEHGYVQSSSFVLGLMGKIAVEQRRYQNAKKYLGRALEPLSAYGFQSLFYEVVEVVAQLCAATHKAEEAALLYASAVDHLSDNLLSRVLPSSADYSKRLEPLKKELGAERFDLILAKGKQMTCAEVHSFAVSLCQTVDAIAAAQSAQSIFTERELDVLRLLAQGKTNEEISKELVVVLKTVEKHVAGIFRKLGVKNRTEAAAWALENGVSSKQVNK